MASPATPSRRLPTPLGPQRVAPHPVNSRPQSSFTSRPAGARRLRRQSRTAVADDTQRRAGRREVEQRTSTLLHRSGPAPPAAPASPRAGQAARSFTVTSPRVAQHHDVAGGPDAEAHRHSQAGDEHSRRSCARGAACRASANAIAQQPAPHREADRADDAELVAISPFVRRGERRRRQGLRGTPARPEGRSPDQPAARTNGSEQQKGAAKRASRPAERRRGRTASSPARVRPDAAARRGSGHRGSGDHQQPGGLDLDARPDEPRTRTRGPDHGARQLRPAPADSLDDWTPMPKLNSARVAGQARSSGQPSPPGAGRQTRLGTEHSPGMVPLGATQPRTGPRGRFPTTPAPDGRRPPGDFDQRPVKPSSARTRCLIPRSASGSQG